MTRIMGSIVDHLTETAQMDRPDLYGNALRNYAIKTLGGGSFRRGQEILWQEAYELAPDVSKFAEAGVNLRDHCVDKARQVAERYNNKRLRT